MTYPPPPGTPHNPQQPDPYQQQQQQYPGYSPQPSDPHQQPGYAGPPQQPGYQQSPPTQYGPGPGGFPPGVQPTLGQKLQSMPPKQMKQVGGIIGGVLGVIIILVIVLASGGGPESVVDDYMASVKDLDVEESVGYLCDADDDMFSSEDLDDPEMLKEAEKFVEDLDWEILNTHTAGDEATVELKVISSTEFLSGTWDVELEKRDGDWFICTMG